jgi:hypothetical protein
MKNKKKSTALEVGHLRTSPEKLPHSLLYYIIGLHIYVP